MSDLQHFLLPRPAKGEGARRGFKAENLLSTRRSDFERHFNKEIDTIELGIHGGKSDVIIRFKDGAETKLQNKNGDSDFHQFQRLPIDRFHEPFREVIASLIQRRFLDHGVTETRKGRPIHAHFADPPRMPTLEDAKELLRLTLFGSHSANAPTCLTKTKVDNGQIVSLEIIPMQTFFETACERLKVPEVKSGGTVIDLGGGFTIQFHGSHKGDDNPDHVQVKFTASKEVIYPFETIL
jgi:hypothetical protein